ncbi:TPA: FRG domain-containing protein [Yersinia enterocolitica]|nr:FRG domain-containing protein [Yersinia enterocolitica]HDL6909026.1 FRG domain-containing protein [Yersinia enterocolitica]HDL7027404.1 FRG domain-containing protein [Yersinia enterocolitica]HDL7036154.1 FRG domain-containing protein [Yersinia enterocolitica]HDL7200851.1 FRG domain-containing protein [Yersinia enterocolitica]
MEIRGVGDFLRVVKELYPDAGRAFFRGQISSEFDVSSSLFRFISKNKPASAADNYGYRLTNKLFSEFKNSIPIYPEVSHLKNYSLNDLDVIMTAQHYGMPTRLIDWTRNPLVALYFSTESASASENISVYMLRDKNKGKISVLSGNYLLNSIVSEQRRFSDFYQYIERKLLSGGNRDSFISDLSEIANRYSSSEACFPSVQVHPDFNCAYGFSLCLLKAGTGAGKEINFGKALGLLQKSSVNFLAHPSVVTLHGDGQYIVDPLPINTRIKNQQGVFLFSKNIDKPAYEAKDFCRENTVSSHDPEDIKKIAPDSEIVRIDIKKEYAPQIHRELNFYGVSRDFIYPELASFASEMPKRVVMDFHSKNS